MEDVPNAVFVCELLILPQDWDASCKDRLVVQKVSGTNFGQKVYGGDIEQARDEILYSGDSTNDAPMFGFFPHSCGVANVLGFAGELEAEPAYVAAEPGGRGFVAVARHLLAARGRAR